MSLFEVDEATQLKSVEANLIRQFSEIPQTRISAELTRVVRRFDTAPVRAFVPVLVQREVTEALRRAS